MSAQRSLLILGVLALATGAALLPIRPPPGPALAAVGATVAAGHGHTCALTTGGGVRCWGRNDYGQLGDGTKTDSNTPVNVVGLSAGVAAVSTERAHSCALTSGGGVKCWGANYYGQLGDGTATDRNIAVDVSGLSSGVAAVSVGQFHTCALTVAGGVKCWGADSGGQLGGASEDICGRSPCSTSPVDVTGLSSGVAAVSVGSEHTCALTTEGGVECWGRNQHGQLGDGTATDRNTAVDVSGLSSGVAAVSAGAGHTCALTTAGGVKCWGYNDTGRLGDGTRTDRATPVDVMGLSSGVKAVSVGGSHTCALTTEGGVKCWGLNDAGQEVCAHPPLGETSPCSTAPLDVSGLSSGVSAVSAGGDLWYGHACAVTSAGAVRCWGHNTFGQLGATTSAVCTHPTLGETPLCSTVPLEVSGLSQAGVP